MAATLVREQKPLRVVLVFAAMLVGAAAVIPLAGATFFAARFLVIGAIPVAALTLAASRHARARPNAGEQGS